MRSRREFMQLVATSTGVFSTYPCFTTAAAWQRLTQFDLLAFNANEQVTLLHLTDTHDQDEVCYCRHRDAGQYTVDHSNAMKECTFPISMVSRQL